VTAAPATSTVPRVAVSNPATMRKSVLLPQPLAPMMHTNSPGSTAISIPRSAAVSSVDPSRLRET